MKNVFSYGIINIQRIGGNYNEKNECYSGI